MPTLDKKRVVRRLPVGAEPLKEGGAHFRVWAPLRKSVQVLIKDAKIALDTEGDGYFSGLAPQTRAGMTYRYVLDGGEGFPDPASRFQPEGPHGPSQIVDPASFKWTDQQWTGVELHGQIIYEMHVGTFTREGTWEAATRELRHLAETGITVLEVMPVADFSGEFGWGYDGVDWFAPCRLYGSPDDMRRFVDTAHSLGMGVILDVVYNHFGPDGNYVGQFSRDYFTHKHTTDWGDAINYDGENCGAVRDFVTSNAGYWIDEYHLDGLRLDATQNIYDDSKDHILAAITRAVRRAAGRRKTIVVAENEPQEVRLIESTDRGGFGMDGLWNDDFHHSAVVAVTGRNEAYYTDYLGKPQELVSAMKYGYLYQGQWYKWQKQRRGTPSLGFPQGAFVTFIENHDQVANSARGLRLHQMTAPGMYRAMTALMLLGPGTPMLFQGQEFASSAPFLFFADMPEWLLPLVREGRKEFLKQWRSIGTQSMLDVLADPCSPSTFQRCKLDLSERERNQESYRFHRDLIRLRRSDPVFASPGRRKVDGAVLSPDAFLLRYFGSDGEDRLLLVNLGKDLPLSPAPEPLLAPPAYRSWRTLLCTESPQYGGTGFIAYEQEHGSEWTLTGQVAVVLASCATDCNLNDSKEKTN
jgi:maltooligosyltrehalose trehalohydrolase